MKPLETKQKISKNNFILKYGVFCWGLFMAVVGIIGYSIAENKFIISLSLIILLISLITGYFWGLTMWNYIERKQNKSKRDKELEDRISALEQQVKEQKNCYRDRNAHH